jgi:hypothetical protein
MCLFNATGTSASIGGVSLTIVLNIVFQAGFTGPQKTFLFAQEGAYGSAALNSGWQQVGTWQIPFSYASVWNGGRSLYHFAQAIG